MFAVALALTTTTELIVHLTHTTTIATTAHVTPTRAAVRDMTLQTALEATIATHLQATPTILAHAEARIALTMVIVLTPQVDALAVARIRQETLVQILIRQVHVVGPLVLMANQAVAVRTNARRITIILAIIQTIIAGITATAVVRAAGVIVARLVVAVAGAAVVHLVAAHHQAVAQAVRQVRVHAVHANH